MRNRIAMLALMLWTGMAQAEGCPDFYRFVDFGLRDIKGELYRGGPVFRAEDFDERRLLLEGGTICMTVPDVSRDGRGNPIPVVRHIVYDPDAIGIDLDTLSVSVVDDPIAQAVAAVKAHRERLTRLGVEIARGPNFLCARDSEDGKTSCQLVSPYKSEAALVVTCDAARCEMPILAMNERLVISASWIVATGSQDADGAQISDRVRAIHGFLAPLSSGL